MPVTINKTMSKIIANMKKENKTIKEIHAWLKESGIIVTLETVRYHAFERTTPRFVFPTKCTWRVQQIVEELTREDDERTALQIKRILHSKYDLDISATSIRRMRRKMGWTFGATRISPMIRDVNKEKRVEQARRWIESGETFDDVIFTDESSVALERFSRMSFRKRNHISLKPRPKHPLKIHVWGGISRLGAGPLLFFEGIMDKKYFQETIVEKCMVPFVNKYYPTHHRIFQDNDPKHSASAKFMEEKGMNWERTPPE
ncbi:uncharacterized protein LOC135046700 [Pseudophryne corroboree]|uniref:uncharacterized protein LOC134947684 n=1 Tax=Pseudophryne corroboree TaxID=495146 RepID=UPI003081446D